MWTSCNILRDLGEITQFHTVFNANFSMNGVLYTIYQHNLITDWFKHQPDGNV